MSYTNGNGNGHKPKPRNVLGGELESCCTDPMTGFYRDGYCKTGVDDTGRHTVCVRVTDEFLAFSKAAGNDLSTPRPEWSFPGLKDGDKWCLCMLRWKEALEHGMAPQVFLRATHEHALTVIRLEDLKEYAADD
ncbi:MAG TPA: DUF2237 domain-containing protein [Pyrinomonadaceae bacterium]|nr:DUF2237 domain-containing protein [Pyrinomonadaceae bacterium]